MQTALDRFRSGAVSYVRVRPIPPKTSKAVKMIMLTLNYTRRKMIIPALGGRVETCGSPLLLIRIGNAQVRHVM